MKLAKTAIGFVCVMLALTIYGYDDEDENPTYYGHAKYHCYYHSTKTQKSYEGVNVKKETANTSAKNACEASSPMHCMSDDCIQK